MGDATFLDTLVRLAAIGAAGVCIFVVFLIGWILHSPRKDATPDWHRSLRFYMLTCVACATVSGMSGAANAWFKAQTIAKQSTEIEQLSADLNKLLANLAILSKNGYLGRPAPPNWTRSQVLALEEVNASIKVSAQGHNALTDRARSQQVQP